MSFQNHANPASTATASATSSGIKTGVQAGILGYNHNPVAARASVRTGARAAAKDSSVLGGGI